MLHSDTIPASHLEAFTHAVTLPAYTIMSNAGENPLDIFENITDHDQYNSATKTYENLIDLGVIDPTLVVLEAVRNAVSAAGMITLAECAIYDDVPKTYPGPIAQ